MIKLFIIQAEIIYDQKKNPESKIQSLNAGFFFLHLILKIVSTSKSLSASVYTEKNISNYKTLT